MLLCPHLSYRLSGMHQDSLVSGVPRTAPLTHPQRSHLLLAHPLLPIVPPRGQVVGEGRGVGILRCVKQGRQPASQPN